MTRPSPHRPSGGVHRAPRERPSDAERLHTPPDAPRLVVGTLVPEPPADGLERWLQGACGTCFGLGAGFLLAWRWQVRSPATLLVLLGAAALAGGAAAARWGDRFWHWLAGNHRRW